MLFQLNFTAMLRPSKLEMDAIETLGNEGWNWDSFLHYMKKVGISSCQFPRSR